jgi:hypothetical protein
MTERKRPEGGVQTGGGAHIAGEVHVGGDFVGRDKRTTLGPGGTLVEGDVSGRNVSLGPGSASMQQGVSIEDLVALLEALRRELPRAGLPEDTAGVLAADLDAAQAQATRKPANGALVKNRLNAVRDALEGATGLTQAGKGLLQAVKDAAVLAASLFT